MPVSFRRFLIDLPHAHAGVKIHEVHKVTCDVLQKWPDERSPYYDYKPNIQNCEWFHICDIIEGLFTVLYRNHSFPYAFVEAINDAFVAQNIGWQLNNYGKVVTRGNEAFEATLKTSVAVLETNSKPTAAAHIMSALRALSTRPTADTSGAVAHATNAVECVLGQITGQAMTLGKYLDKHSRLFHPALKKGLDGIYGYASDEGARHGKEGTQPTREDAEFVLAVCAATCTLLIRKEEQAGK